MSGKLSDSPHRVSMTASHIHNELGTWLWWIRAAHIVVRHGKDVEDIEAIGPTATVDPTLMVEGPWWGEKPWFTDGLSEQQTRFLLDAGYPPKLLLQAAVALRRLLPRDLCAKLAQEHETRMLIAPLYQQYVPFVRPLLALGCDLAEAAQWSDEHLLKRLLIPAEHWGAATEVSVAAALQRSGLRIEREPLGRDGKRPEFLVHLDFWRYFVEVKTNRDSLTETRADLLERAVMWLHGDLAEHGVVTIEGSQELHALLKDPNEPPREDLGVKLRRDLREFVEDAKASGRPPTGWNRAGSYLLVEVAEDRGHRGTSVRLAPKTSDEEGANRVIRQIRKAAKQIPLAGRGFVVVEIGSVRNIAVLQEVLETAFAMTPGAFEPIRGVVFHVGTPTETGHRLRRIFGGAAQGRRLDAAEEKILRALLFPRCETGETIRETLYGAGRVKLIEISVEDRQGHR